MSRFIHETSWSIISSLQPLQIFFDGLKDCTEMRVPSWPGVRSLAKPSILPSGSLFHTRGYMNSTIPAEVLVLKRCIDQWRICWWLTCSNTCGDPPLEYRLSGGIVW